MDQNPNTLRSADSPHRVI
jgi:hypothetical protein